MKKAIDVKLGELEAVIERLLFPVLDEFTERGESPIAFSIDEPDDARTRVDASIPRYVSARLEAIDLNLVEIFDDRDLVKGLDVVGARVSATNANELKRVAGISIRSAAPEVAAGIEAWRSTNVALIKSLAGQELLEITKILRGSEAAGLRVEVLRKQIEERFSVTRSKASLLARDQTLTLNSQIAKARQQSVGVVEYIWTTSGDERVRETHGELDGTRQRWDTPPVISDDGRTGHPGDDYQCRCTAFPVIEELKEVSELPTKQPKKAPIPKRRPAKRRPTDPAKAFLARDPDLQRAPKAIAKPDEARRVLGKAFRATARKLDQGGAATRRALQDVLEGDGLSSKDFEAGRENTRKLKFSKDIEAHAYHHWDGLVEIKPISLEEAQKALRLKPATLKKHAELVRRSNAGESLSKVEKKLVRKTHNQVEDLNVFVHEELHGASPFARGAYKGVSATFEEATTELLAQRQVKRLFKLSTSETQEMFRGEFLGKGTWTSRTTVGTYAPQVDTLIAAVGEMGYSVDQLEDALIASRKAAADSWKYGGQGERALIQELLKLEPSLTRLEDVKNLIIEEARTAGKPADALTTWLTRRLSEVPL